MHSLPSTYAADAPASSVSPDSLARALSDDADAVPASWFEPRRSSLPPRRSSVPVPVETVGGFLGDDVADAWLR